MVSGKKGFDRLIHACKNVFSTPVTWLFCDLSSPGTCFPLLPFTYLLTSLAPEPNPLAPHFPVKFTSSPGISRDISVNLPPLGPEPALHGLGGRAGFEDFAVDIYEWLSLVRLESPRVDPKDNIDSYLSLYQAPGDPENQKEAKICKISWEGLLSPSWTRATLVDLIVALPRRTWFSLSMTTFPTGMAGGNSDCTILRPPNAPGEYILWEVKGHE